MKNPLLLAKLAIVLVLLVGMFTLVGLGKVEWKDASQGVIMISSALVVALGLRAAADGSKGDGT